MRRLVATLAIALVAATTLEGCGNNDSTASGPPQTKVIAITVHGDNVDPNGERVDVAVGQRVELDVTADAPGEIHVHSSPEQEFEYDEGSSTIELDPIETPGVVTVESHTLDKVILQLRVS